MHTKNHNTIINDSEVLHKIIEFQSYIIQGEYFTILLKNNIDFFLTKSGADIITIYMHEHPQVNTEYILEKNNQFTHLLKKYVFDKKTFRWEKFVANCDKHFSSGLKYEKITELYQLFRGFMSKNESASFTKELQIKGASMMPVYDFRNKEIIGYICFFFQSDKEIEIEQLKTVTTAFETLLRPLYDNEYNTFYNKCLRVDENMNLLSKQEKKIVKKVLNGLSYGETAEELNISINTLKTHMKNIFNKYNVNSKIELYNKLTPHS